MRFERSKEWWLKMCDKEIGVESVACGVPLTRRPYIPDNVVRMFEEAYLAAYYPDERNFAGAPEGSRQFEAYRAGLSAAFHRATGEAYMDGRKDAHGMHLMASPIVKSTDIA